MWNWIWKKLIKVPIHTAHQGTAHIALQCTYTYMWNMVCKCTFKNVLKVQSFEGNLVGFRIDSTGLFISPWNMVENWLMPQLNEDSNDYIFQQDGSPSHYKGVWGYLNQNLPQKWIGHTGKDDDTLMRWPPRSPDLTLCDFFFSGVCEGHCLCASTPR